MVTRIKAVIIALLFFVPLCGAASNNKTIFSKGNRLYRQGRIEDALAQYKSMPQKGPGVWFNMGNCFFALQDYQQAFICWRRAQYKAPAALVAELTDHLEMVRSFLHKDDERSLFLQTIERWAQMMPVLFLQLIFLCCWYLFWFFLFSERPPRWLSLLVLISLFLLLLTGTLLLVHYATHLHKKGVVIKESMLLTGPHDQYHEIGSLHPLDDVQIKEARVGWYKVGVGDRTGWIAAETIETI